MAKSRANNHKPVTLITGTRKGIGRFLVHHFITKGHVVVGCSRQKPDWQVKNYFHYLLDVADEPAVVNLFSILSKKLHRLDNLINNAGISFMTPSILTPISAFHEVLNTNLIGTFLFCREAARLMCRNRAGGRIVNFSSVATPLKLEGESIYAASKAAVVSVTEILARELAPYGITVNCVGPNPIPTDLINRVPKEKIDSLISRQAIPRHGTFEDVANVVDFFLRKESSFITGQNIYLGGVS